MLPANTAITLLIMMLFCIILINSIENIPGKKVQLVSVVFRHGDRTPDIVYPKMPYTDNNFYPDGVGGLTKEGKERAFTLGVKLRERYNDFLGSIYNSDDVHAQSTDYARTKMTLQLVLAGIYPPNHEQQWKSDLHWQPIPTVYVPEKKDNLLLRTYYCKAFLDAYESLKKEAVIQESLKRFDQIKDELSYTTGWPMNDIYDLYTLDCNLVCLNYMNRILPNWSDKAFNLLNDSTLTTFNLMNYNNQLKRLNGGALLKKVTEDMDSVANDGGQKEKLFLYSSHDLNVYAMLAALNVVEPHLPHFTSAVIIELYTINEKYYVNVLHYLGIPSVMKSVEIPNCPSPCPLETFNKSIKDVIPSEEELQC
ncbi:venom acid phosphatase Acph-1-like [Leptopilina boulardi]|uniref:venom acid phosphatase Acph-1-like n=1 Tax=Leptopilina boulardi TaxID=63433 RepID=UPI0021F5860E|nr:venom acid phosphatase Acph-1-like [Leptopilina boulardi]XP_051172515.1 venom acid phosphatase Acph-1-like [Leptopilina boulardi]XP_051172516.1 venom acid phosphatase Acph-1-like [Leptopilina boulardi]